MSLLSRYSELGVRFDPSKVSVKKALRVNTLKISEAVLVDRLRAKGVSLKKVPFVPFAYWYDASFSLGATPEYLQGYYYLQEVASQIPPLVLDPCPGDFVLDMAAAPGSKTTQLAQLMNNQGVIVALDIDNKRLGSLRNNIERLGVENVVVFKKDARFAPDLKLSFDKVLLDAPCSGNFCVEPDFFSLRSLADFRLQAKRQRELLKSAFSVLKPGGVLVYSTCSLEPEEDELVIDWFLDEFDDVFLEKIDVPLGVPGLTSVFGRSLNPSLSLTRRFWPHLTGTQGFFIAKLRKKK